MWLRGGSLVLDGKLLKRESHYGDKLDMGILPNEGPPITATINRAGQE
jgi:hypothetical protein